MNLEIAFFLLTFGITAGQIIKLPLGFLSSSNLLDIIIALLSFYGVIRLKNKLITPPAFIKVGLGFALIGFLALMLTPLTLNLNEFLISVSYLFRFVLFLLFGYLIFISLIPLKKVTKPALLLSGTLIAVLGLVQFIFLPNLGFLQQDGWDPHYFRTVSTFLDPNFTGTFLVLNLLIIFLLPKKNPLYKWKTHLFVLLFLGLLTTYSRSAGLMFGVSFLTLSLLKKSFKLFLLTTLLCLFVIINFSLYQQEVAIPRNINRQKSAEYRINSWHQGFAVFKQWPIFGVGFNAYRFALKKYNLASPNQLLSRGSSTNDSSLLYVLATTGLVGLIIYFLFLASLFKMSWKNVKLGLGDGFVLFAGLIGLLAHSFFANSLFYPFIFLWIVLMGVANSSSDQSPQ